jgi:hypothetical protein
LHEQPLLLLVRLLVNEHNAADRLSLLMQEDGMRLLYYDGLLATAGGPACSGGLQVELACGGLVDPRSLPPRFPTAEFALNRECHQQRKKEKEAPLPEYHTTIPYLMLLPIFILFTSITCV